MKIKGTISYLCKYLNHTEFWLLLAGKWLVMIYVHNWKYKGLGDFSLVNQLLQKWCKPNFSSKINPLNIVIFLYRKLPYQILSRNCIDLISISWSRFYDLSLLSTYKLQTSYSISRNFSKSFTFSYPTFGKKIKRKPEVTHFLTVNHDNRSDV